MKHHKVEKHLIWNSTTKPTISSVRVLRMTAFRNESLGLEYKLAKKGEKLFFC